MIIIQKVKNAVKFRFTPCVKPANQKLQSFSQCLALFLHLQYVSDELWAETALMVWGQGTVNHSNRKLFHF